MRHPRLFTFALGLVAFSATALADGLVPTAEEIDLGTIFGIGFPAFRGGLMRHAAKGDAS